jgi:glucosamine-6-phosphate deaminase
MEIIICPNAETASLDAANHVAAILQKKPASVLGLATGSTPVALYKEWIRKHQAGELDFSMATSFNLDEYVGLGPEHPASYRRFMQEHLFHAINLPASRIHVPDGLAIDIPAHCQAYEAAIQHAGGIDVQILGIGSDGHIGFNEPTSSLASRTRLKTLTERTRTDNARFFNNPEDVPHHVITMGVGTIMEARSIVVLAFGKSKARAVADMVEGPVSAMVPATILQMHPVVKVFLDEDSASALSRRDYYRHVFSHKPDWQRW